MRSVDYEITLKSFNSKEVSVKYEAISQIYENKETKNISVETKCFNADHNYIKTDMTYINGDDYDLLMAESPDFAANKPKDEYREDDLFYIIDLIRARQIEVVTE